MGFLSTAPSLNTAQRNRFILLIIALVQDFFVGGIIFGWSGLVQILEAEGVYHWDCAAGQPISDVCDDQTQKLILLFTVGSFTGTCSAVVMGFVLDHFGPRASATAGSTLGIIGCLLFAFSTQSFQAYIPGIFLICLGGPGVHIALFHLASLFPRHESTIMSMFGGIFGASAFVFVLFHLVSENTAANKESLFIALAIIFALVGISSAFLWPDKPYDRQGQDAIASTGHESGHGRGSSKNRRTLSYSTSGDDSTSLTQTLTPHLSVSESTSDYVSQSDTTTNDEGGFKLSATTSSGTSRDSGSTSSRAVTSGTSQTSSSYSAVTSSEDSSASMSFKSKPLGAQMMSKKYLYVLILMFTHVLRNTYFYGTINNQLKELGDGDKTYTRLWGLIFPLGFISTPAIGKMLDVYGVHPSVFMVNITGILYSVFLLIDSLPLQVATFVLVSVCNNFLFSCFFSAVGMTFGFKNYGKLTGLVVLISAAGGLSLYGLSALAIGPLDNDYFYINLGLLILLIPYFLLNLYWWATGQVFSRPTRPDL